MTALLGHLTGHATHVALSLGKALLDRLPLRAHQPHGRALAQPVQGATGDPAELVEISQ